MLDSEEKVQSQLDETTPTMNTTTKDVDDRFTPKNGEEEIEIKELNKRALVEHEIEQHPYYQAMQRAVDGTNVSINLERIVDRYFELAPTNNVLENKDFYEVSSEFVKMALEQTASILSSEENGIVFNLADGSIDADESRRQRRAAIYSTQLKEELTHENAQHKYRDDLREAISQVRENNSVKYTSFDIDTSRTHAILASLFSDNRPYTDDELRQASATVANDDAVVQQQEQRKDATFIETKDDFYLIQAAMEYTMELYATVDPEEERYSKQTILLNKVRQQDKKGKFLDPETQAIDPKKVTEFATQYRINYSQSQNYKKLKEFSGTSTEFAELDDEDKRDILRAILSINRMPKSERDLASITLKRISPDCVDLVGNDLVINEESLFNLYNSTFPLKYKRKSIEDMKRDVREGEEKDIKAFFSGLQRKIERGEFVDVDIPPGLTKEEEQQIKKEKRKAIHAKQRPQINKPVQKRLENEIDKIIKSNGIEGDKAELIVAAFHCLRHISNDTKDEVDERNAMALKEYIEGTGNVFGKYVGTTGVTLQALAIEKKQIEDIMILARGIANFQTKQDRLEQHKLSPEHIKEHIKDFQNFIREGINIAAKQSGIFMKQLFSRDKQKVLTAGEVALQSNIFGDGTKDEKYVEEATKRSISVLKRYDESKKSRKYTALKRTASEKAKEMEESRAKKSKPDIKQDNSENTKYADSKDGKKEFDFDSYVKVTDKKVLDGIVTEGNNARKLQERNARGELASKAEKEGEEFEDVGGIEFA